MNKSYNSDSEVLKKLKKLASAGGLNLFKHLVRTDEVFSRKLSTLTSQAVKANCEAFKKHYVMYSLGFSDAISFIDDFIAEQERNAIVAPKVKEGFVDYDKLAEEEGLKEPEFIPGRERIVGFDENVDDFESSDYDRDDYTRERDDYDDYDDCGEDCGEDC